MTRFLRLCGILMAMLGMTTSAFAQANLLTNQKIGVYISSRAVSYGQDFYIPIAQFVTQEDDAAWNGRLKSEFLIRMGWMLSEQLQGLSEADTVYFMNADLPMGRAMQEAYDPILGTMDMRNERLRDLDFIVILDEFEMNMRIHRSVYIRSNRMVSENIPIKTASCQMTLFDLSNPDLVLNTRICLDDQKTPNPAIWHFDMLKDSSAMGKFLSKVFSTWWDLMLMGERSSCGE